MDISPQKKYRLLRLTATRGPYWTVRESSRRSYARSKTRDGIFFSEKPSTPMGIRLALEMRIESKYFRCAIP